MNPKTNTMVKNPKEIADTFSDYYEALYNLKDDPTMPQPTDDIINDFLASVDLPTISQIA